MYQDARFSARLMRLNPAFFAVAVLSLALGIGANTAIFELLNAVRLRLLPVPHAEELAELEIGPNDHCCSGNFSARRSNFTYAQWQQIRDHQQAFSSLFAFGDTRFDLTRGGEVRYAEGLWVSGDFFKTLQVNPLLGRVLTAADDQPGCGSPGVVISYPFWQRNFGGKPQALGSNFSLNGHMFPVVGITPANFFGVEVGRSFDVAVPICAEPLTAGEYSHLKSRRDWWLAVIGRLKPGWTVTRASAQANAMSPAVFTTTVPPTYRPDQAKYYVGYKLIAHPAGSGVSSLRERYEEPLLLLLGIAGLVLLIACANLANLMLARATTREREMAVRLAIGAKRARLIRQLLIESLTLAAVGTIAGMILAKVTSRYLVSFLSTGSSPLFLALDLDWRVLAFTAGTGILTCVLFGLAPALRVTRTPPVVAMKAAGRGLTADRERFSLRRTLVITQVALSVVLLIGALLFVRSLRNLITLDSGLRQDGLLIANIDFERLNIPVDARQAFFRNVLERVRSTPGVSDAAASSIIPLSGNGWNDQIEIIGKQPKGRQVPWFDRVSPGYFRTAGTPILAGRDFDEHDTESTPEVAVVNQTFAKKYFDKESPLGKRFRVLSGPGEPQHEYLIVGVAKDSKYRRLQDDFADSVYVAQGQEKKPDTGVNILVRSNLAAGPLTAQLKQTVAGISPEISIEFHDFKTQVAESLMRERLMARLSGFFGFIAALLASVGLYGVLSYMVVRRRGEIGIRMALGADRRNVVGLVLREAGLLLLIGIAAGGAAALGAARAARSLLFGLKPNDPSTIALAVGLLCLVSLVAAFLPAWRASRLQPMTALREE